MALSGLGGLIFPKVKKEKPAVTEGQIIGKKAEATPSPATAGLFGGFQQFTAGLTANPILLLIVMVVLVFIIGKLF